MEQHLERLYFKEEQRFPLWIRAFVLLPVVALGFPALLLWFSAGTNLDLVRVLFTVLALGALVGAALTFMMKLVTKRLRQ